MASILRRRALGLLAAAPVCAAAALAAPSSAQACGGTFCDGGVPTPMPVNQTGENILFEVKDGWVEAQIQIQYNGDPANFAWIVPMMAVPQVAVGSEALMQAALAGTVPTYTQSQTTIFCEEDDNGRGAPLGCADDGSGRGAAFDGNGLTAGSDGGDEGGMGGPEVIDRGTAGAFEYVVLSGGTVDELVQWLDDNAYVQDDDAPPILDEYLQEGFMFLALKLRPAAGADELHPVAIRYQGDEPCIPIRLTRIAAEEDMGIRAFFLGEERVASSNYKHVVLNELKIGLLVDGATDNYEDAVTLAVDEAGGKAFVTEYAGTAAVINTFQMSQYVFSTFGLQASPIDALEGLADLGMIDCFSGAGTAGRCAYAHPQLGSILNKYIPVPDSLIEEDFYGNPSAYEGLIDYTAWDGVLFSQTLEERIVNPAQHALDMVGRSPYLTRLFTTMSPHEMLEDPLFLENPDLDDVTNTHTSIFTNACRGSDFITFDDGTEVTVLEDGSLPDSVADTPYALRVETCMPSGPPDIEVDNGKDIVEPAIEDWVDKHPVRRGTTPPDEQSCTVSQKRSSFMSLVMLTILVGFRRRRSSPAA